MNLGLTLLGAAITAATVVEATPSTNAPTARSQLIIGPEAGFAMRVVAAHNQLRSAAAVQPLRWDAGLAASAEAYAVELVRTGRFAHSQAERRQGTGENLWMGSRGAFPVDRMVADWASEKRWFRAGRFPGVSTTGRWEDVGHYTQIIWPTSVRVGCAVRSSRQNDYFVCHYAQGGNVFGQMVGTSAIATR